MTDYANEMNQMHHKYNVHAKINALDKILLLEFLKFRIGCIEEELNECKLAVKDKDADGVVDALIDMTVFAIGTLDLYGVDANKAWSEVYRANMNKEIGIKASRPNPYGLPDLIKPVGWQAPSHIQNLGKLESILSPE